MNEKNEGKKCCGIMPIPWVVEIEDVKYNKFEFEFSSPTDACNFIETANAHSVTELKFKLCQKVESEEKSDDV